MFSVSDEAYAVSNATPSLIEAATQVIGSSDDNGVARWLSENLDI
jgi:hydroxymethylpyrimidine pyrophosphatase-like HAD family hydrolase